MKHTATILGIAAILLAFSSCKKNKSATADTSGKDSKQTEQVKKEPEWQPVVVNKGYEWPGSTDAFNVTDVRVSGDTLLVDVNYGGGCKDHVFTMSTNGAYMKSLPPQMMLWLEHESNDDMCRAMIHTTLKFDLRSVRYQGGEEVVLIINEDRERRVSYTY